jgi:multidrug efflux pump subunit AcrB
MTRQLGVAGRLATTFIDSKLTPLAIVGAVLLGVLAVIALPREEEPQIVVPMVDVFVDLPGAPPAEVEQRLTRPIEQLLSEVPGVEYVYSTSSPGQSLVIVRFLVGQNEEDALVRLNHKLAASAEALPPGASTPVTRLRSIDDVPIVALTLWSERYDDVVLRRVAAQLRDGLKEVPEVSEVTLLGGRPRAITVELDAARLEAHGVDPLTVQRAIQGANERQPAATVVRDRRAQIVEAGGWLERVDDVRTVVLPTGDGRALRVGDVATVVDGGGEPTAHVAFDAPDGRSYPAVTLAVAKRRGANAIVVAQRIAAHVAQARGVILPADVHVAVTRDYGRTAAAKSNELLWHMFLAVISVSVLIGIALGRREAAVVLVAIPVTLALTLFVFYAYGYTLNRITLFALIFSIGILVDDAIVVVENIVRHMRLPVEAGGPGGRGSLAAVAVRAVDEVGGPTILATLTVVAAILPMAFVGGLMGPYMRPIPVGASAAMLFSLAVAFTVTPWAARRLLRVSVDHSGEGEDRATALYRRAMRALVASPRASWSFLAGVVLLLVASAALVPLGWVTVKMLPFDNKSEFQVLVDMPEGTPLEATAQVTRDLSAVVAQDASVANVQRYVGTASPYNFNGLVRHYFLRGAPHQADLQVNLVPAEERSVQSHAVATRVRDSLAPVARRYGARLQVAEVPPGPPVLQTLVAEVYGPDHARRLEVARQVRAVLEEAPGVVDVDWYVEDPQDKVRLDVDEEKAAAAGISPAMVAAAVRLGSAGGQAGVLHDPHAREPVPVVLRLPRQDRSSVEAVRRLRVAGRVPVSVGELTRAVYGQEATSIYHKNTRPVTYITGDVAGVAESPVYAILEMNRALARLALPEGYAFEIYSTRQPDRSDRYAMKWDGEWHITYEVFRDLGLAFAAVLVLIYVLVVGWFRSFTTPATIMAAIPFSLVGILPAHSAMGAFFTATSMIGFIAGAGIVVRNSIILVDFIELRRRDGMPLADAVIDAGAVRFRPMALTAAAVVVGAGVILFDPIFQGLAISLMAGEVASLFLSRVTVPVLYYLSRKGEPA